jgi:16S rRNA (guanine527-N7)-methyltransferase
VKLNARSILERMSEKQTGLLRAYSGFLRSKAVPLGLIATSDTDRLWDRHILDSLRGLSCFRPADQVVLDLGSGAGLPGIPLAIAQPGARFTLVEPNRRRAAFLEAVADSLELPNTTVMVRRVQEVELRGDLCLARALAGPVEVWRRASRLLAPNGRLVYWAGRSWGEGDIERLTGLGAKAEICLKPEFPWQGPLVIMSRFPQDFRKDHERAGRTS